jgi:hypothetical protein
LPARVCTGEENAPCQGTYNFPRERFLVVDLSAPVTVLKSQFLACLERAAKQKISTGPGYADWENLGVLPYIDLELWRSITLRDTIPQHVGSRALTRMTCRTSI